MRHSAELHKNAFWVYGVLVGLAIREIVGHVIQRWIEVGLTDPEVALDLWRMSVFILLIVRFFLGSSLYFHEVYAAEETRSQFVRKSYVNDFLIGLAHFVMFYACAASIRYHNLRIMSELSHFAFILFAILLYDLVWYSMMHLQQFDTKVKIARWAKLNAATVALSALLYISARLTSFDSLRSEYIAFTPVVIISLIDLKEMLQTFDAAD